MGSFRVARRPLTLFPGQPGVAVRIQDGSASVPTARAGASADVHAGLHLSLMAFPDFCRFVSPLLAALRVRECNVDSVLLSCSRLAREQ